VSEYYFTAPLDNSRTLHIAPLTDRKIEASGQDIPDPSGYFLFETREDNESGGVEIIAQVLSEEAVFRLRDMLKMS
jgi:hypothetical protein